MIERRNYFFVKNIYHFIGEYINNYKLTLENIKSFNLFFTRPDVHANLYFHYNNNLNKDSLNVFSTY